jgi:hypothetical protein
MPRRLLEVNGQRWEVAPAGRTTQYLRDEFSVVFSRAVEGGQERRLARYSPVGTRSSVDSALAEMPDYQLCELFDRSQPSWTAAETEYRR